MEIGGGRTEEGDRRPEKGEGRREKGAVDAIITIIHQADMYIFEHYCPASDKWRDFNPLRSFFNYLYYKAMAFKV